MAQIVKVSFTDLPILQKLSVETFRQTFAKYNTPANMEKYLAKSFNAEKLAGELSQPGSSFYFAIIDGEPAGYLKVNTGSAQTDVQDEDALEIERIYVRKLHMGSGVGKQLLDKALELAREQRCPFVWLGVWEKNTRAIRFYEKHGFVKFGSHPFWLGDDEQTDWLMRLDLSK